nr:uncharacterized protein LOC121128246 [Lepeophtheirus salmonis]
MGRQITVFVMCVFIIHSFAIQNVTSEGFSFIDLLKKPLNFLTKSKSSSSSNSFLPDTFVQTGGSILKSLDPTNGVKQEKITPQVKCKKFRFLRKLFKHQCISFERNTAIAK